MLEDLQGLYYFGRLSKKDERTYKNKDWKEAVNYSIVFEFMGWKHNIWSNKEINSILEEGKTYALPVGTFTKKELDFSNLFILTKDNKPIYNVVNWDLICIN